MCEHASSLYTRAATYQSLGLLPLTITFVTTSFDRGTGMGESRIETVVPGWMMASFMVAWRLRRDRGEARTLGKGGGFVVRAVQLVLTNVSILIVIFGWVGDGDPFVCTYYKPNPTRR